MLLIDPRTLPGGHVGGVQADPTLSGTDPPSPLLADVDLSGLTVEQGAAHRLTLPKWLTPVAWSPSSSLLAAGDDGHTRLAVLSFAPTGSDLPQLSSFPILVANIVGWGLGWTPSSATAGTPVRLNAIAGARTATVSGAGSATQRVSLGAHGAVVQAPSEPGLYTIAETGPGVAHRATVAVNLGTAQATPARPIDIRTGGLHAARQPGSPLALLAAGGRTAAGRARVRLLGAATRARCGLMSVTLGHPWTLLLLVAVAAVAVGIGLAVRPRSARAALSVALPALAATALVMALAAPGAADRIAPGDDGAGRPLGQHRRPRCARPRIGG